LSILGMDITEKLIKRDDSAMVLEYSIIDSPLNAESHLGRVSVHDDGDKSRATWYVEVVPDTLTDLLSGTYQQALDALKVHLEEKSA
jgi:Polyketide cyclase / dehydrase and lipid transport